MLQIPPPKTAVGLQAPIVLLIPPVIVAQSELFVLFIPNTIEFPAVAKLPDWALIADKNPDPATITPPPPLPVLNPDAVTVEPFVFVKVRTPVPEL